MCRSRRELDLALSEYGACLWCEPELWVEEAARLLRPGGRLVFLTNSVVLALCIPERGAAGAALLRGQREIGRLAWPDDGVEFHLAHSASIDLLARHGFTVERLAELYAPGQATLSFGTVSDYRLGAALASGRGLGRAGSEQLAQSTAMCEIVQGVGRWRPSVFVRGRIMGPRGGRHVHESVGCPCVAPRVPDGDGCRSRTRSCGVCTHTDPRRAGGDAVASAEHRRRGRKRRILLRGAVVLTLTRRSAIRKCRRVDRWHAIAEVRPGISAGDAEVVDCDRHDRHARLHHHTPPSIPDAAAGHHRRRRTRRGMAAETYASVVQNIWTAGRVADPQNPGRFIWDLGRVRYDPEDCYIAELVACLSEITQGITTERTRPRPITRPSTPKR